MWNAETVLGHIVYTCTQKHAWKQPHGQQKFPMLTKHQQKQVHGYAARTTAARHSP